MYEVVTKCTLFRKKRFLVNLQTERNASKFAMFMEKENPHSFFHFSFKATFIFALWMPWSMSTLLLVVHINQQYSLLLDNKKGSKIIWSILSSQFLKSFLKISFFTITIFSIYCTSWEDKSVQMPFFLLINIAKSKDCHKNLTST